MTEVIEPKENFYTYPELINDVKTWINYLSSIFSLVGLLLLKDQCKMVEKCSRSKQIAGWLKQKGINVPGK